MVILSFMTNSKFILKSIQKGVEDKTNAILEMGTAFSCYSWYKEGVVNTLMIHVAIDYM